MEDRSNYRKTICDKQRKSLMFTLEFSRPTYLKTDKKPEVTWEKTRVQTREKTREIILELIAENPQITTAQLFGAIGITPKGVEWQITRQKIRRSGTRSANCGK